MGGLSRLRFAPSDGSADRPARTLALVMGLPLLDGLFPALVVAGAIENPAGILEVGLLVFAGSATIGIILAELDAPPRRAAWTVCSIGIPLICLAAFEAALAPTVVGLVDLELFQHFAGLVVVAVAASTASARVADILPRPAVLVGVGLLASINVGGLDPTLAVRPALAINGAAAAAVGVLGALCIAVTAPWLRDSVDLERSRFGAAVALGVLGLSIIGVLPGDAPLALAVLAVTGLFAFDPDPHDVSGYRPDDIDVTAAFDGGGDAIERSPGPQDRIADDEQSGPAGEDSKAKA